MLVLNLREQMQVEIRRIHREVGITTIYVTHDQTEAMTMSDRIAVFNNGMIEQVAPPLEMYLRPATHFVGNFIGDSNFIDGTVIDGATGRLAVDGIGEISANGADPALTGNQAHALIRPENIHLLDGNATSKDPNRFEITVEGTVNFGDSVLIIGDLRGQPIRIRAPGVSAGTIDSGNRLHIGWRKEDVHLIVKN